MTEIYEQVLEKHNVLLTDLEEAVILHKLTKIDIETKKTIRQVDDLIKYWSKYYGINREIAEGSSRLQQIKTYRYMVWWSIRNKLVPNNFSLDAIGRIFNRHHATVLHGLKAVDNWIMYDQELRQDLMNALVAFGFRAEWNAAKKQLNFLKKGELYQE
jgi:chromosomal replication initiation ATPase DnaA